MIANDRGRFLPIARIHRARETILEQALRAQQAAIERAEMVLAKANEEVERADARIAALVLSRCGKSATHADELTRFDLRTAAARSARDDALNQVNIAAEKVNAEYDKYRQLMKKLMREHEFVEAAMKQHRIEKRHHQQKIEIAAEEVISDSLRPTGLTALSF
jgi:hypothetical protein